MTTKPELPPIDDNELWYTPHVKEIPTFERCTIRDYNPLSGTTKIREVWIPNEEMQQIHISLVKRIRKMGIKSPFATGGFPGNSPHHNVLRHANNRYFYQVDLVSAYEQVDPDVLAEILASLDIYNTSPQLIANFLRRYCIHPSGIGLLTGSPSSPDLFNAYLLPLDEALGELSERYGLTYTRYIDDLTFSVPDRGNPIIDRLGQKKRQEIRRIIIEAGLEINHRKTRVDDLVEGPILITGLQLNPSGKWQLPTRYMRYLEAVLAGFLQQIHEGTPLTTKERASLTGINGLLQASIDRRRAIFTRHEHKLLRLYERLKWIIDYEST